MLNSQLNRKESRIIINMTLGAGLLGMALLACTAETPPSPITKISSSPTTPPRTPPAITPTARLAERGYSRQSNPEVLKTRPNEEVSRKATMRAEVATLAPTILAEATRDAQKTGRPSTVPTFTGSTPTPVNIIR